VNLVDSAFFPDLSLAVEVMMEHHVYSCCHLKVDLILISKYGICITLKSQKIIRANCGGR